MTDRVILVDYTVGDVRPPSAALVVSGGTPGATGESGTNGREVEMGAGDGYFRWRYVGDSTWTNLAPVPEATEGGDGQPVLGLTITEDLTDPGPLDPTIALLTTNGTFYRWGEPNHNVIMSEVLPISDSSADIRIVASILGVEKGYSGLIRLLVTFPPERGNPTSMAPMGELIFRFRDSVGGESAPDLASGDFTYNWGLGWYEGRSLQQEVIDLATIQVFHGGQMLPSVTWVAPDPEAPAAPQWVEAGFRAAVPMTIDGLRAHGAWDERIELTATGLATNSRDDGTFSASTSGVTATRPDGTGWSLTPSGLAIMGSDGAFGIAPNGVLGTITGGAPSMVSIPPNSMGQVIATREWVGENSPQPVLSELVLEEVDEDFDVLLPALSAVVAIEYSTNGRFRIYRTAAGRTMDTPRDLATTYPGGRGLVYSYQSSGEEVDQEAAWQCARALSEDRLYGRVDADAPMTITIRYVEIVGGF